MTGTLIQLLSLITHGNQYFTNLELPAGYYPGNSAFKFCNQVNFIDLTPVEGAKPLEALWAADPLAWFERLKQDGCRTLMAYYHPSDGNDQGTPDHKLAGFIGGGGTWLIEAVYEGYSDFWAERWEVSKPDDPDQMIWAVSYGRTINGTDTIAFSPDHLEATEDLREILIDIRQFAAENNLESWTGVFDRSLNILDASGEINNWYAGTIAESIYPESAMRLIYAAMSAHVFGGMGSWNDLGFEDKEVQDSYDELSYHLYDRINRALLAAVNVSPT